ncbi:cyclic nucleotide-binding domain-containing protein [Streptomyces sp. JJ38]|uniref:cyclic nucleotide-binding domain-containing protein n=1 Tax=Streptomyces sp. JJ38 TaxID=2738128 RepID=UPI001C5942A0|nr:cyclic nucleotide-binding domain-containing protein [Streptomyces sp. JJ38]MBW1596426.1 cyclic nucleotide-binding domain-containing protein [Streptomyces sp. JJ38]
MITTSNSLLSSLPEEGRARLLALSRPVEYPAGTRIFREGQRADRFWIIRSGTVAIDLQVPGRRPAVVETLRSGDLIGWSWLVPPHAWHLGAEARSHVRAWEFDAVHVRELAEEDPGLGYTLAVRVAEIVGHRLQHARTRLLDLYGPYGSGQWPEGSLR